MIPFVKVLRKFNEHLEWFYGEKKGLQLCLNYQNLCSAGAVLDYSELIHFKSILIRRNVWDFQHNKVLAY